GPGPPLVVAPEDCPANAPSLLAGSDQFRDHRRRVEALRHDTPEPYEVGNPVVVAGDSGLALVLPARALIVAHIHGRDVTADKRAARYPQDTRGIDAMRQREQDGAPTAWRGIGGQSRHLPGDATVVTQEQPVHRP